MFLAQQDKCPQCAEVYMVTSGAWQFDTCRYPPKSELKFFQLFRVEAAHVNNE